MIRYHFEALPDARIRDRIWVVIDEKYFWSVEWSCEIPGADVMVSDMTTGFVSETIREKCKSLEVLSAAELSNRLGTFAHYIERAVSGFQSYIAWICPDPPVSRISWQIPE